ncbi:MAG: hypothetical protein KDC38_19255 [Planctomycetes bacterium]|nr:hypothetical protein [Planctomycetota bacterium]
MTRVRGKLMGSTTMTRSGGPIIGALLSFALLTSCGSPSFRSFDRSGVERSRTEEWSEDEVMELDDFLQPAEEVTSLVVENRHGEVTIEGLKLGVGARPAPAFEWKLSCWADDGPTAERLLDEVRLVRTFEDGRLSVRLEIPDEVREELTGLQSDLYITLAPEIPVDVENHFGQCTVRNMQAAVNGDCSHCEVTLFQLRGRVKWATSFAPLYASALGESQLVNRHGALHVEGIGGDVEASTSFGAMEISEVRGSLKARNSHGALEIDNVDGSVDAKTSFGPLRVENAGDTAKLRNSHGSIHGTGLRGSVDAETGFAEIDLESAGERARIENAHGEIRLAMTGQRIDRIDASTTFAPLRLEIPEGLSPQVEVDQSFGSIRSAVPVNRPTPAEASGPPVRLKVRHGDIEIELRPNNEAAL